MDTKGELPSTMDGNANVIVAAIELINHQIESLSSKVGSLKGSVSTMCGKIVNLEGCLYSFLSTPQYSMHLLLEILKTRLLPSPQTHFTNCLIH